MRPILLSDKNTIAYVDDEDHSKVKIYKWRAVKSVYTIYVMGYINKKAIYLHRFLMNAKKGQEVDHIDSNGLNNTKENLRICSVSENKRYRKKRKKPTSSKYLGVYKNNSKWIATVTLTNTRKTIYLGRFKTEEEAAKARDIKAIELYGTDFIHLNFPKKI